MPGHGYAREIIVAYLMRRKATRLPDPGFAFVLGPRLSSIFCGKWINFGDRATEAVGKMAHGRVVQRKSSNDLGVVSDDLKGAVRIAKYRGISIAR